jgi:hypothetical protein
LSLTLKDTVGTFLIGRLQVRPRGCAQWCKKTPENAPVFNARKRRAPNLTQKRQTKGIEFRHNTKASPKQQKFAHRNIIVDMEDSSNGRSPKTMGFNMFQYTNSRNLDELGHSPVAKAPLYENGRIGAAGNLD